MAYLCYLIVSTSHARRTYVGVTNNFTRRRRQHNGEIVGGAKATRGRGPWTPVITVTGFRTYVEALMFEWAWKHQLPRNVHGLAGRLTKLCTLLRKDRWTARAPPAEEVPLLVHCHSDQIPNQEGLPAYISFCVDHGRQCAFA